MAYFPNGTSGEVFENQCNICKYDDEVCPIWYVQTEYNYDACNNELATKILNYLVKNDGTCMMFKMCKKEFYDAGEKQFIDSYV